MNPIILWFEFVGLIAALVLVVSLTFAVVSIYFTDFHDDGTWEA